MGGGQKNSLLEPGGYSGGDIMRDLVAKIHFQALAEKNPEDVCRCAGCHYDDASACYSLSIWGTKYIISPNSYTIDCLDQKGQGLHEYFSLFAIHYLLTAKETGLSGKWISEKDIPGGSGFFRGPHEIPTHLISHRYGDTISAFQQRCEQLQGLPLDMADAAYCFNITPRIPAAVLYWAGDDEFPAESKILYDSTIAEHFALDVVYALAVGICHRLG